MQSIATLFYQGLHRKIVDELFDAPDARLKDEDAHFVVAALCFLGRLNEAESLLQTRNHSLADDQRALCLFFLGINSFRLQKTALGRGYVRELTKIAPSPMRDFFVAQAKGLMRFYQSQIASAAGFAERALANAILADFYYGRVLAQDFLGHCEVIRGSISMGLRRLELTSEMARKLGNAGIVHALETSILLYKSQHGHLGTSAEQQLTLAFENGTEEDYLTQNSLLLEIARQQTLAGKWAEAEASLNKAVVMIFAKGNPRQEVLLDLRFAQLAFLRGQSALALNHVRNARKLVDGTHNHDLLLNALGLEYKIKQSLRAPQADLDFVRARIEEESRWYRSLIGRRMLSRMIETSSHGRAESFPADDIAGELKDMSLRPLNMDSKRRIVESGYLSFLQLQEELDLPRGSSFLVFGFVPSLLLIGSSSGLRCVELKESSLPARLIMKLAEGPRTKEQLIESIWGYQYDPARHDTVLYSCIQSCRRVLTDLASEWIQMTDQGYALAKGVLVRFSHDEPLRRVTQPSPQVPPFQGLNERQLRLLETISAKDMLSTRQYSDLFAVSEQTANRDLRHLMEIGLLTRVGKGRATCYSRLLSQ